MKRAHAAAVVLVALLGSSAAAEKMTPQRLAKRVGQVLAGYNDFWVWVKQTEYVPGRKPVSLTGRAWFKRDRMFRLNFGQPPRLIHATDGDTYWVYDARTKKVEYTDLDENAPLHPLLPVFAMGDRMARALDRYFNARPVEEVTYGEKKRPAYKLQVSLKPEELKKLREQAKHKRLLPKDARQVWTFWVDKKTLLPKRIEVEWSKDRRSVFEFPKRFHHDVGLRKRLFRIPPGVEAVPMPKKED